MSGPSTPARAAAGRIAGTLAAVCALTAVPAVATATTVSLLNNGDFEGPVLPSALRLSWTSAVYGQWAVGDPMAVVGTVNGIAPLGGASMMDFSNTSGTSADVYQIVDLTPYAAAIDAGLVTVDTSAYFDSVATASVGLALLRWAAAPVGFTGYALLHSGYGFTVDGNRSTWQQFGYAGTIVPVGTRYLGFGLNSPTSAAQTYADNASLVLHINDGQGGGVPEPGTIGLVLGSLLLLPAVRRRVR